MRCSRCGSENPAGKKFCGDCGAPLANLCPDCGSENPAGKRFCGECGAALAVSVQGRAAESTRTESSAPDSRITSEADPSLVDGERKTVTALFADLKGSTELIRDLDPEGARAIVDPALRIMVEAVRRYDGYVVQSTGDGIFALFGAPLAHEDHPQRALHTALQMREALQQRANQLASEGKPPIQARIGINSGEVVMRALETGGRFEYTPVGYVTNLAARLQTAAPAGEIAISEETRRLVEGYFELRPLGPTEVKGVAEPINVYQVTGLGPLRTHFEVSARRGLTKFVGREKELRQLKHSFELACRGRGQIGAIVAEAGTGKTRLVHELKQLLPGDYKLLEAFSVSHGKDSPWLPVLALLRGYFHFQDTDDTDTLREKVRAGLGALDPMVSDAMPYLLNLLAISEQPDPLAQMDAQLKHHRTLESIKRVILRESLDHPVVVIFEDLHWVDAETQGLLDVLADGIASAHILLLVSYRPEYRHAWGNKSYYSQLRLEALDRQRASEMLTTLLGESAELDPVKRMVIERTGGNPFFIEEMVQALFDEGTLVGNGAVRIMRPLGQLQLPPTVQGIVASRIDRQPGENKQLLQTLAVISREARLSLIRQMVPSEEARLQRMLADLQAGEFINELPALPDSKYVFKHALTHEVAYNSLLIEHRKLLHERAAMALETIFAQRLDDHVDELAYHYSNSENVTKAIEYHERAGQQAMQRSSYADAIRNLTQALRLLEKLPANSERMERELFLQLALGAPLFALKGWATPEVERAYGRALQLCQELGESPQLFPALFGLWGMHFLRANLEMGSTLATDLLQRANSVNEPALSVFAHLSRGYTSFHIGELLLAREDFETALSLYKGERDRALALQTTGLDAEIAALSYLSVTLWQLGFQDQALERGNKAIVLARELSHPNSMAFADLFVGRLHIFRRDARMARQLSEHLMAIGVEHGSSLFCSWARIQHAWALAIQGQSTGTVDQMQEGLAALDQTGTQLDSPYCLCLKAEAYAATGRVEDAITALNEALAVAEIRQNCHYQPEVYRLKGELLLRQDKSNVTQARSCFEQAIDSARQQSAKSWELRATLSLARLPATAGRREDARNILAAIYSWFTEGFDGTDLKSANDFFEELGS
jgi:predicted ATPase/class 3 adenylate cyclase